MEYPIEYLPLLTARLGTRTLRVSERPGPPAPGARVRACAQDLHGEGSVRSKLLAILFATMLLLASFAATFARQPGQINGQCHNPTTPGCSPR
jgi:hypothetical protein